MVNIRKDGNDFFTRDSRAHVENDAVKLIKLQEARLINISLLKLVAHFFDELILLHKLFGGFVHQELNKLVLVDATVLVGINLVDQALNILICGVWLDAAQGSLEVLRCDPVLPFDVEIVENLLGFPADLVKLILGNPINSRVHVLLGALNVVGKLVDRQVSIPINVDLLEDLSEVL